VGDSRLIYKIEDDRLVVQILRIGDRKEIYRSVLPETVQVI
jgi:mRNA-degrading endonuclease RelE of RelBE toxin-antitoxin system